MAGSGIIMTADCERNGPNGNCEEIVEMFFWGWEKGVLTPVQEHEGNEKRNKGKK